MAEKFVSIKPKNFDFELLVPERNIIWYKDEGYKNYSSYIFTQLSKNSDLIVDVGAHVGFYSLLARLANKEASIIAVEPNPDNLEILRQNTASENITIVAKALKNGKSNSKLFVSEISDNASLFPHPAQEASREIEVESISGVELISNDYKSLLIKIDIEGFEIEGLQSFDEEIFSLRNAKFLVEFNPRVMQNIGFEPQSLLDFFHNRDYRMYLLDDSTCQWYCVKRNERWRNFLSPDSYANLLCVPEELGLAIATIMHSSGLGGAERCQVELASDLVGRGMMVKTFLPTESASLRDLLEKSGSSVEIYEKTEWWTSQSSEPHANSKSLYEKFADKRIIGSIKNSGIDVVHTQTAVIPQGAVAAATLGLPHVWYVHEYVDLDHKLNFPITKNKFSKVLLDLSESIVCNSLSVARYHFGEQDKVKVIYPNPILIDQELRKNDNNFFMVGIVGNHNEGKGHFQLIEAIGRLIKEGYSFNLRIIGSRIEPNSSALENLIIELGIQDFVEFEYSAKSLKEIYGNLDCVVIPSKNEAFGRVPFEATACGIPVIYSNKGGLMEYMSTGKNGISFDFNDILSLKNAILKIALSEKHRNECVKNARKNLGHFLKENNSGLMHFENFILVRDSYVLSKNDFSSALNNKTKYLQRKLGNL